MTLIFSSEVPPNEARAFTPVGLQSSLTFFSPRGKPKWACLGTGGLGVIILREAVPALCLCIGAFVKRRQELP